MSLIKWNPEETLMPAWADDFLFTEPWQKFTMKSVSLPAVNVTENKEAFKMEVAAPGFKKEDFKIENQNGYLTVSGEIKDEKEEKKDNFTRREFKFNSFSRSFMLPENVNADKIEAVYNDGILRIMLPKMKTEKTKPVATIPIR